MAYSTIRLIGGPADGMLWGSWAGEGVFQVHYFPKQSSEEFQAVEDYDPAAVTTANNIAMYQVAHITVWGRRFSFAHPVNTDPAEALATLLPGGKFAGV